MPDAPTPLDLAAIRADLDARVPARDLEDRNHARGLLAEVERLRARHVCRDMEDYAEAWNAGYETAVTQGLADDPARAEDWLAEHDERVRRAARLAPAWDEEVVVAAVARAIALAGDYDGCFERLDAWADASDEARECGDVEEPLSTDAEDAAFWLSRARAALAVVREHLPAKPDREAVARVLNRIAWQTYDAMLVASPGAPSIPFIVEESLAKADAVLDLWPGESRATVQAAALHEAGQDLPGEWSKQERRKVERWLRDRADRLAAEGGADRG